MKSLATATLLLLLLTLAPNARGQEAAHAAATASDTVAMTHIFTEDLTSSIRLAGTYLTQPLRWEQGSWITAGGVATGTALSIAFADQAVRDRALRDRSATGDQLANIGNVMGGGIPSVAVGGVLYLGGLVGRESRVRTAGLHVAQSFAYAGVAVTALKFILGRARPYTNEGTTAFHGPSMKDGWYSLPSGHVTVATALASSLACDLESPVASVGLGALAATTVFARIYTDHHWLADTFLGAALGTATGVWVTHQDRSESAPRTGWLLSPTPTGLAATYQF